MKLAEKYPHSPISDSLERGLSFQDFVCIELAKQHIILQNIASKKWQFDVGENLQGFEIKLDNVCTSSRRLSIEVAEKTSRDVSFWTPSGIMRDDNSILYIQGNYQSFWMFSKKWLRRWLKEKQPQIEESHGTIKKFYLGNEIADVGAVWKWDNTHGGDRWQANGSR